MDEAKQAVETTASAPVETVTQEVVKENTAPVATQQEQTANQEATQTTQTSAPTVSDVDEFGVPWKNRASEYKRKNEELIERLPQMLEEKLTNFSSQQNAPRKYSIEELEQFASSTDNPAHATWAKGEIRKLELEAQSRVVREEIGKWRKEQEDNVRRQQAHAYVSQTYPDAFIKNQQGQIVGWNNQHPLTQQIGQIMQDPRFAKDPEGLVAAADIAFARLQRSQQPVIQQQVQKQKEEIKNLQRSTLVESGSRTNVTATTPYRSALEKAKQTGNLKDVANALKLMADHKKALMEK